ncbi:filamentous hemagglutinin N-terminal domain-containing protein [Anabaenopsis arnoldii]|uniref:Filamentous hemagglutinin N-terminal domain-containing protein n=1 Tax=Anabaenopsis arnoldii TaxID=2152938 RepID=A0ABT5AP50_9CYAN|nr:filamentous hemagglutinin N-terminal domain-containing protein [Anabaenopsis arnoldii]MDB9539103.1 filamentous hemagglutinin N-terminal domain-containing protein [Anabaenopsis arnoldii]
MNSCKKYSSCQFILPIILSLITTVNPRLVKAQLIPDNTLNSSVRNETIKGNTSDIIEGGVIRGINLFHSFTDFNVGANQGVYFSNPDNISNILTRVTGISHSNILGTLGVLGNANLFLINPNGITFGANANLDVKGSFVASTADKVIFDNYEFNSTNPTQPPLLNINIPRGLGFRDNPGNISLNNSNLTIPEGKTLALIGGNVSIDNARIISPGSQVELGGLTQTGTVNLDEGLRLSFPDSSGSADIDITKGNVSLTNGAQVNVTGGGGGSITINSRNLDITRGSQLRGGIASGSGSVDTQAGNIQINNTNQINLVGRFSVIDNLVRDLGTGNAGYINITTGSLTVKDSAYLDTSTSGQGNAGNINILALRGDVIFENTGYSPVIYTGIYTANGQGKAGDVNISVKNGSLVAKNVEINLENNQGRGNAGNINLTVKDNITFDYSDLRSYTQPNTVGDGGNINVIADQLTINNSSVFNAGVSGIGNAGKINLTSNHIDITDGSQISASTSGIGNAGNIEILADGTTRIDNSLISSRVNSQARGSGGDITIKTNSLEVTNGSQIQANSFGVGNSGNLNFHTQTMKVDGVGTAIGNVIGIFPRAGILGRGNAGDININTGSLEVINGASLLASLGGEGQGGNININADNLVKFDGFGSVAENLISATGVGNTGNINIATGSLEVTNNAYLNASTSGQGNGGNINIHAREQVTFANGALTGASSNVGLTGVGNAGDIIINTNSLNIGTFSGLTTATLGKGRAGNIIINAANNVDIQKLGRVSSDILNGTGNGGDIQITTSFFRMSDNGVIEAKTGGQGNAGKVEINAGAGVEVSGKANISTNVEPRAVGNGNDIIIISPSVTITDQAQLVASTGGQGNSGNVRITASDQVVFEGGSREQVSGVFTVVKPTGRGDAGNIEVNTSVLTLSNGSEINASTLGAGKAGNIVMNARQLEIKEDGRILSVTEGEQKAGDIVLNIIESINLNQGNILATTTPNSTGEGGNILIDPMFFTLNNGSRIGVSSEGRGDAGNINLRAGNLTVNDSSALSAGTFSGEGGNIILDIDNLLRLNNGEITTAAGGTGNGGNININAGFLVGRNNSQISANAVEGNGGNIQITTNRLFFTPESMISASSQLGIDGVVETKILGVDSTQGLIELPETIVDGSRLIAKNVCSQGSDSEFYRTGRGGLPVTPNQVLETHTVDVGLVKPVVSSPVRVVSQSNFKKSRREIVPARGMVVNQDGSVILVGYDPGSRGLQRPGNNINLPGSCS